MTEPIRSRPHMPGYGIHDDQEGLLSWDWVVTQIEQSRNYWICSTRPDGRPHAAPVWGVWVHGTLYFGTIPQSVKGRNLAANPAVVMHLESGDDSVIVEGAVERESDRALLVQIADAYEAKYPPFRPALEPGELYLAVRPKMVLAWHESDFPRTATRWTFGNTS